MEASRENKINFAGRKCLICQRFYIALTNNAATARGLPQFQYKYFTKTLVEADDVRRTRKTRSSKSQIWTHLQNCVSAGTFKANRKAITTVIGEWRGEGGGGKRSSAQRKGLRFEKQVQSPTWPEQKHQLPTALVSRKVTQQYVHGNFKVLVLHMTLAA
jgi:hypothetical protein